MNLKVLYILFFTLPSIALSQSAIDTMINIDPIEIYDHSIKSKHTHGSKITIGASQLEKYAGEDLNSIIQRNTSWFIRSYGISGISSLSAKGASASQNTVLWNGVPINNPMVGQIDLRLLSLNHATSLEFAQNSFENKWGYGTIGAVIDMKNELPDLFKPQVNLNANYGSFENFVGNFQIQNNIGPVKISSSIQYNQGENNFPYNKIGSDKKYYQEHAAHRIGNIQQSINLPIAKNQSGTLHYWLQQSRREIPPTTTQSESLAKQWDRHGRFLYKHTLNGKKYAMELSLAYLNEFLRYQDEIISLDDTSRFQTLFMEINQKLYLNPQNKLEWRANLMQIRAFAPAYAEEIKESILSFQLDYALNYNRQSLKFNLGLQSIDFSRQHFIPAISYIRSWDSGINVNFCIQKNFRNPGLNDQFWVPGGNPDLRPEHGISEQLSFNYNPSKGALDSRFNVSVDFYHRLIKDWILWAASNGGPFYYATNLAVVRSYGVEVRTKVSRKLSEGQLDIQLSYQYTRSKNEKTIDSPFIKKGQQLYYVPIHQSGLQIVYMNNSWSLDIQNNYISESLGINENLAAFFAGDIHIKKELPLKPVKSTIGFYIQNFTNANYRLIERRPMPGRNIGIRILLSHKNK